MDYRKKSVCIYANGRIFDGPHGITFASESGRVKMMSVDPTITLERLKEVVGRKLKIAGNQFVSDLIYRYPATINPPRYEACNLEDESDVEEMWRMNARFETQLGGVELYACISNVEVNNQPESQPQDDCYRYAVPSSSTQVDPMATGSRLSMHLENFHPFEDIVDEETNIPSSSLALTEDVVEDFEDEEEYNFYVNIDHDDRANNENDEVAHEEHNEGGGDEYENPSFAFYSQVNVEAAVAPEFCGRGDIIHLDDSQEFSVGQTFNDVHALRRAAKLYSVRVHHTFKVHYSSKKHEEYRCVNYGNNCIWRIRASKKREENSWQIKKYDGHHTCLATSLTQDHPKLDSDVISSCIVAMVTEHPDVKVGQIMERMRDMFGYSVSYKKAWRAKQLAIATAFGNWESSYTLLPRWLTAVQHFMPGSCIKFANIPCGEPNSEGQSIEMFKRVFWAFKPCIDSFDHLKPIV